MQVMGHIILLKIFMATNTRPPIITIPITLIRTATITIRTLKDMGAKKDRWALATGPPGGILGARVVRATVVRAMGAGIETRRLSAPAK
jgi:hypothetical protein